MVFNPPFSPLFRKGQRHLDQYTSAEIMDVLIGVLCLERFFTRIVPVNCWNVHVQLQANVDPHALADTLKSVDDFILLHVSTQEFVQPLSPSTVLEPPRLFLS
jgi:hypothetical protein